jgi:hypothetical protein
VVFRYHVTGELEALGPHQVEQALGDGLREVAVTREPAADHAAQAGGTVVNLGYASQAFLEAQVDDEDVAALLRVRLIGCSTLVLTPHGDSPGEIDCRA